MSGSEDIVGRDALGLPAAAPQDAHRVEDTPMNVLSLLRNIQRRVHREYHEGYGPNCPMSICVDILSFLERGKASGETSTPSGSIAEGDANSNASLIEDFQRIAREWFLEYQKVEAERTRLSEQVEKQGKVVEAVRGAPVVAGLPCICFVSAVVRLAADMGERNPGTTTAWPPESMTHDDFCVELRAALNGLVVVGEDGNDVSLHSAAPNEPNGNDRASSARGNVRQ